MNVHYEINNRYNVSLWFNERTKSFSGFIIDRKGEKGPEIMEWVGSEEEPIRSAELLADILEPCTTIDPDTVRDLDAHAESVLRPPPSRRNRLVY